MIAMVKVAPVERWCPRATQLLKAVLPEDDIAEGCELGIDTRSMRVTCGERIWQVVLVPENITVVGGSWLCEHMVEMD